MTFFTHTEAEFVGSSPTPTARFSSVMAACCSTNPYPARRFTAANGTLLGNQPAPQRRLTSIEVTYLAIRVPNLKWISMILEDVFPNDISYNSVGTIRFATDVIVVDSGDDQRVQRWDQPLMEFDVAYGVRTMEQLQDMIAFFRAMRGRLYAFNYRDWLDYTSSMAVAYEAREAPPISNTDQIQFVGDGVTFVFQLVKSYIATTSGTTLTRPITRLEPDTVVVAWSGANGGDWTGNCSVDNETGIVTLLPTNTVEALNVTKTANSGVLHAPAGTFSPYLPSKFHGAKVVVSGFVNAENNATTSQTATISAVANDGGTLTLNYAQGGASADTAANFSISIHPAPPQGVTVTAGFRFYVPCRFDTDQLPLTLEDYGIGGAQSIKLVEVRPTAF